MLYQITHSPILQAIFSHAASSPNKIALVTVQGEEISYGKLADEIEKAASFLYKSGVGHGDRIMLSAEKDIEFVYLYFGSHLIGAINVVVDAKNNSEHLSYIASITKPMVAFGMTLSGIVSIEYSSLELPNEKCTVPNLSLNPDQTADVMFTSGTTGKPKGVKLSHYNIFSSASNINEFIRNEVNDVELLGLPICHSFGLGRLRCNMLIGSTVVLHNGFANIKSVFSAIEYYNVTGFGMVPAIWSYIKRFSGTRIKQFSDRIKYIEIGSAAMSLEDKMMLMDIFPNTRICMHYGLTEASRAVFMEFHENQDDLSTIGKSVSSKVSVAILDENGNEMLPLQEGEICIKGNMVISSYYEEKDNENSFINGYFRTGDWGYKSEDGRLFLVARKKELINIGGKKVSPIEIEDALSQIGVGESMCVAIKDPDKILGEVPKVYLVRNTFTISVEEIKSRLQNILESFKMPRFFEIVDSIPKTSSGKKKRIL